MPGKPDKRVPPSSGSALQGRFLMVAAGLVAASLAVPGYGQDAGLRQFLRTFRQRAATLFVNPDMNGDCLISKQEAEHGADETIRNLTDLFRMVTEQFDQDGDGRLSVDEAKRLENLLAEYGKPRPKIFDFIDRNHDWNLDDQEVDRLRAMILARYERQNRMVLEECDANGDGRLEGTEIDKARDMLSKFQFGGRRRLPRRGREWKRFRR